MAATTKLLARYITAGPVIREVWQATLTSPTTEATITPVIADNDTQGIGVIKQIDLATPTSTSHTAAPILEVDNVTNRKTLTVTTVTDNVMVVTIEGLAQ